MMENVDGNENQNKAALNVCILSFVDKLGLVIASYVAKITKKKNYLIANSFNFNSLQDIRDPLLTQTRQPGALIN